ncbi:ArsC family reductase [Aquitalea aquatica]|uniref:ArsC family reductase n=1 Tax=Aquitalea aquatica TaxID=3044273 RepID=A0A838YC28_9NEIS|nr:ArsC family reductase [Aquitalea magnusonii]MBA4710089.1 ArsC family reductase [Aquitalea magnusonii]
MITLYGIPNCNTVKKARQWLTEQQIDYVFHDFKKQGVTEAQLQGWIDAIGLYKLINRQGTTWRGLSDELKAQAATPAGAIAVLQAQPSIIKRPVLEQAGKTSVGFNEAQWAEEFGA